MTTLKLRSKTEEKVELIPIYKIAPNPAQPRKTFDYEEISRLADSISKNGLIQPVLLRKMPDGGYNIISGERRVRAISMLGRENVPAIVREVSDTQSATLALIENIQRKDLSFFEEARAIEELIRVWGLSQDETAQKLGKAQSTVANKLRLLKLPEDVRGEIEKHGLTERHARAIVSVENEEIQRKVLSRIIEKGMNVAQTEEYISSVTAPKKDKTNSKKYMVKDVRLFLNTINHAIDRMVLSGVDAKLEIQETVERVDYIVTIPKEGQKRMPAALKTK